jgi:hypothetical protein
MFPWLRKILIHLNLMSNKIRNPEKYWDHRYVSGGNSGSGSYNQLAEFKAGVINRFIADHRIKSAIEFGCGDGNQLSLIKYPAYTGLDISRSAIQLCQSLFREDKTKSFYLYHPRTFNYQKSTFTAEVSLSLDVIFHIMEQEIFELYMTHLFESARKYVIIYSSNYNSKPSHHERDWEFTTWVSVNMPGWRLIKKIENQYPWNPEYPNKTSKSDFYIYEKIS